MRELGRGIELSSGGDTLFSTVLGGRSSIDSSTLTDDHWEKVIGVMRTNRNIKLPSDLWSRMAETARAEGRSIDELVEEAARGLLKLRELRSFVAGNAEVAAKKGLTEADVPRLIAESRAERARQ
jgi:hypothetical protein